MRRTGFTLIELLVVIAIIAILAAILFPIFERAQSKAHQAACMSNLKQIGLSTLMYCHDWDNMTPSRPGCGETRNALAAWTPAPTTLPAAAPEPLAQPGFGGRMGWLWPYLQNEEVFFCPQVQGVGAYGSVTGTTMAVYNYGCNGMFLGTPGIPTPRSWTDHPLDYVQYPAHFVIFSDHVNSYFWHLEARPGAAGATVYYAVFDSNIRASTGYLPYGGPVFPNNRATDRVDQMAKWDPPCIGNMACCQGSFLYGIEGRHTGMANMLYLDGHVGPIAPAMIGTATHGLTLYSGWNPYYFDAGGLAGQGQSVP